MGLYLFGLVIHFFQDFHGQQLVEATAGFESVQFLIPLISINKK
jgi:hypothetical protein